MVGQWELLKDAIPDDHARQVNSDYYIKIVMRGDDPPSRVLDLGCGTGRSIDRFLGYDPDVTWVGVDIADSPETRQRTRSDHAFVIYDGVRLPFAHASFPVVFSHQVLEHVRFPERLLAEVARILTPGGRFIGSTSQMEPYHSFSLWNFTTYGFKVMVEAAGLILEEIRPSIDGFALTRRAYLGRPDEYNRYFLEESPTNAEIDEWGRRTARRPALINNRKLMFCGQFAFSVRRPSEQA